MSYLQLQAANAATKKQGYGTGLHAVLQRRKELLDPQVAAKEAGIGLLPDGSRDDVVPHTLPSTLLAAEQRRSSVKVANTAAAHQSSSRAQRAGARYARAAAQKRGGPSARRVAAGPARKPLVFGRSGVHGWGVFAAQPIQAGAFVIEYTGKLFRAVLEDIVEQRYIEAGQNSSYLFRCAGWFGGAVCGLRGTRATITGCHGFVGVEGQHALTLTTHCLVLPLC
jgi:hypothetical protein